MRLRHFFAGSALAALLVAMAAPAGAGTRIYWNIFPYISHDDAYSVYDGEYDEPVYARRHRPGYRVYDDEDFGDDGYAARYDDEDDGGEPVVRRRRLDQVEPRLKRQQKAAAPVDQPVKRGKPPGKDGAAVPARPKPRLITCAKATKLVTGFGFESVKPADCQGQIYAFSAARSGKPYTVKLSAVTGELTEVAKK